MTSTPARSALVQLLSEEGRSQAWLSRLLNLSQNSVSLWTRGLSRPEHHLRLALQNLLGIPAESWFTADERRVAGLPELEPEPEPAVAA
jgi:transcriptional regulator with XRE-family HTH domain